MTQTSEKTIFNEIYPSENVEEVIAGLIDQKINFLKIKNLSSHVIYFKPDDECQSEINRLDALKSELISKMKSTKERTLQLRIVSYLEPEQHQ
jgi:hypothetical protein